MQAYFIWVFSTMLAIEDKLCLLILNEHFGPLVTGVAKVLLQKGSYTFKHICSVTHLPKSKIQECLCVLIKHNLVTWTETQDPEYILHNNRVLLMQRFPRYIYLIRDLYGEEAEMVVDLLAKEGQATISQIIIDSAIKLLDASSGDVNSQPDVNNKHIIFRNAFEKLLKNQYIQRCPNPTSHIQTVPILTIKEEDLYRFDGDFLDLKLLQKEIQDRHLNPDQNLLIQSSKTVGCHPDKDIYWRLNYDRFHLEFRDREMQKSIGKCLDAEAESCFASLLNAAYRKSDPWAPVFNSVLASEVRDLQKDLPNTEQYLKVMTDCEGRFLRKMGEAGGGEYVLDVACFIKRIAMTHIDNIVRERYGSNAAKIFRLVREHEKMLQNSIGKLSMISGKDSCPLVHKLLKDSYFRVYEVRKGAAPMPASKNFYLLYVDQNAVVRLTLKMVYQAIYNLMKQRSMRHQENKRLLERKSRVEMIVENLKQSGGTEEQIQEVEDAFTPSERELVKKVIEIEDKLLAYTTYLDETVFLMQMHMYYECPKP